MKKILDVLTSEFENAFEKCGYDKKLGKVGISNRPDLCEYQCNGAMAGAKVYHKAPIMIANDVVAKLADSKVLEMAEAVNPGFINLKVSGAYMAQYLEEMRNSEKMGVEEAKDPQTMILDYGGPNVAKPLHVGHLRSAIIGESIKRMGRYLGHKVIGDVHLGDWGLQMGLIITELHKREPELVYFQEDYEGEYPTEAPFTISELEEIYPAASGKSKEDVSGFFKFCANNSMDFNDISGNVQNLYERVTQLDETSMTNWIINMSTAISEKLKSTRNSTSRRMITDAQNIVKQRYMEPDISLDEVCADLGVSNSYFSSIFKKETGQPFVTYLTDYRMDRAEELVLNTDEKSYKIAEKVGYQDANYFSYVFKKKFGVSPSKYRASGKKENEK